MLYLTAKTIHLLAMIAWFAGMFYLPRLFVYHSSATDQISLERFQTMERRLYRGIMNPAMIATLVFGILMLVLNTAWLAQGWIHAKLFLVVLLVGYHHVCLTHMKRFARGENTRSATWYRVFNEVPTVLLILIVILAVFRPF